MTLCCVKYTYYVILPTLHNACGHWLHLCKQFGCMYTETLSHDHVFFTISVFTVLNCQGDLCLHLLLLSEMRNCPTDLANTLFIILCCAYKSPYWKDYGFWETSLRSSCFSFLRAHAPFLNSVSHSSVNRKGDPTFYHLPPRRHSLSLSLSFF